MSYMSQRSVVKFKMEEEAGTEVSFFTIFCEENCQRDTLYFLQGVFLMQY
nr:MAG TPA: hypothetical protein [Caudoviricetes sp.]DAZ82410.1 MAG TPA: hypothetical protein [Caudoviricetes sp.]